MLEKLEKLKNRFNQLSSDLSDPKITQDQKKYVELSKEYSGLQEVMGAFEEYKKLKEELESNKKLLEDDDEEMKELAQSEIVSLTDKIKEVESKLKLLLAPKDPLDEKNAILEIRAGAGGAEAALFASDLFKMYSKYAEEKKWKYEILSSSISDLGGYKEVIILVEGQNIYGDLRFESGVHRVQRVPETETQGRLHTSAVTVAVLPEADEVEININPQDLKIDVFRSSGPGGQSVNTTDSAVRITHVPSGLVVSCQDEKSQHKNKSKALKVLRARLLEKEEMERDDEISKTRKKQVGSGDRSERIRTYNFPQNRVTDHRIGLTLKKLDVVMEGRISEIIEALKIHAQTEQIKE